MSWLEHYIDDFITVGAPRGSECGDNAVTMHRVCQELGMPIEPEKMRDQQQPSPS